MQSSLNCLLPTSSRVDLLLSPNPRGEAGQALSFSCPNLKIRQNQGRGDLRLTKEVGWQGKSPRNSCLLFALPGSCAGHAFGGSEAGVSVGFTIATTHGIVLEGAEPITVGLLEALANTSTGVVFFVTGGGREKHDQGGPGKQAREGEHGRVN